MNTRLRPIMIAAGVFGLINLAHADTMHGADIKTFLSGNTTYQETTATSESWQAGRGVIYWADDGTALYKTPSGTMMHGKWEIKGSWNCIIWNERPGTCVRYDKTGNTVTVIDPATGKSLAKIVKTAPGNVEKLAP